MGFDKNDVDKLLAECGRRCCICGKLHRVQVHHIVPGDDRIKNGIPLCPNCHDEVHTEYSQGRTTRPYTPRELRFHRERTIKWANRASKWSEGSRDFMRDRDLVFFFAQCLDRPAFRAHFHEEVSFDDFDKAMEDTLLALNTGYWRTRDGALIQRGKGKLSIVNPEWRDQLDKVVEIVEGIRRKFHEAYGLTEMLMRLREPHRLHRHEILDGFRHDRGLGRWMDEQRQDAIDAMNRLLSEADLPHLKGFGER